MKACLTGNTSKGVEILADLFIETRDPTYLFNQGRCFEQNRRYEDAIARFREYLLRDRKLGAEEKVDAERHIAACQFYLGKIETGQPALASQSTPAAQNPGTVAAGVCERGTCLEAPAAAFIPPSPAAQEANALGAFRHGLFGVGSMLGFHGWGHIQPGSSGAGADVSENFWPGLHLSGYKALGSHLLLGGYFLYAAGEVEMNGATKNQSEIGFGLSFKLGGSVWERTWLGVSGDLGALFHMNPGDDTLKGISLFPRFELGQILLSQDRFQLGVYVALGPLLIPYTDGRVGQLNANFWMISMQGIAGLALGY
jgi:tetratricopeptide (TPR) repeat protein